MEVTKRGEQRDVVSNPVHRNSRRESSVARTEGRGSRGNRRTCVRVPPRCYNETGRRKARYPSLHVRSSVEALSSW